MTVAAVTVANGGDNIAVYAPLFAGMTRTAWPLLGVVFAVLTALWCAVGLLLVRHPTLGPPLRRVARPVLPWVLVALGLYILLSSGLPRALLG